MRMSPCKQRRRLGVASFIAVAALGMVAAAALAMVTMLKLDHRRTQASDVDAQLRQLLIAGAAAAEADLESQSGSATTDRLQLPPDLAALDASLTWQPTDAEHGPWSASEIGITVIATIGKESAYQRLRFAESPEAGGYRLVAASYHP